MVSCNSNGDFVRKAEHSRVFVNHALVQKVHLVCFVEADDLKGLCPVDERLGDLLQLPRLGLKVFCLAAEAGKIGDVAEDSAPVCQ